jgi:poly-gamma-glutamate synthesis protein (capsule biosynthesis protein)
MSAKPESRAARRKARSRARLVRFLPWIAAGLLAAAVLLLLPGLLRSSADLPAMADAMRAVTASPEPTRNAPAAATDGLPAEEDAATDEPDGTAETDEATPAEASPAPDAHAEETPAPPLPAAAPASEPVKITISAAGDCTLGGDSSGRSYSAFAAAYKKNGAAYFLKNVRDIFAGTT